jgi:hypothetical protein
MGERADAPANAAIGVARCARLSELCVATAAARRRLAAANAAGAHELPALLHSVADALTLAQPAEDDHASLLALLDELGGLVDQLELERKAVRARLAALDRHGRARRSYARGPRVP